MPNPSRREAPALDRRRNPHIWSWILKLIEDYSRPSLAVKLLGLLVEWSALLDSCETLDAQSLAGLVNGCKPRAKFSLGCCAHLLAHNLASLVLLESGSSLPTLALGDLASEEMTPRELGRDWLLLHGFHGLHGGHRFIAFIALAILREWSRRSRQNQ